MKNIGINFEFISNMYKIIGFVVEKKNWMKKEEESMCQRK